MKAYLYTDGGVRTGGKNGPTKGRSGPGSIAYVIRGEDKKVIEKGGMYLEETTVNEAEWSGLIMGLAACQRLGVSELIVRMDSQLVVMQFNDVWAIRAQHLQDFYDEAKADALQFQSCVVEWIPRSQNSMADQITREIMQETNEAVIEDRVLAERAA